MASISDLGSSALIGVADGELDAVRPIQLFQDGRRERGLGRAEGADMMVETEHLVETPRQVGQVVGGYEASCLQLALLE